MNQAITKEMLSQHFAGHSTVLQRSMIADWLQHPANQQQYIAWLDEWERQHLQYVADEDAALNRLTDRINSLEQPATFRTTTPVGEVLLYSPFRWLIAASVTICLVAGLYVGKQYLVYRTVETAFGETRRLVLPDGSRVTLNAHSALRIPRFGFGDETRTVQLTGEAAFSIRHTSTHQRFVVSTNRGIDIVVLGTEFNVYNRPAGTKVVLSKGAIQLNYTSPAQSDYQLRLTPGDIVKVDSAGRLTQNHTTEPELSTAWSDHRFVFNGTTVREVTDLLRDTYNLRVVLKSQQLADRTITGSFRADNADEFLRVVTGLLEINYKQHDNTVTFFD